MKKAVFNKTGMRQLVDTGYKKFDKATNYIGTGNVIANTQYSLYIRPYNETECNGFTNPKGHLLNYDLSMFKHIPLRIREILCNKTRTESYILYLFFIKDTTVGWVITDNRHRFVASQVEVYALTYTVGYYSGYKELVGVYSTKDKAEKAKQFDMKQNGRNEWNYKIDPLHVDKTVKEKFMKW